MLRPTIFNIWILFLAVLMTPWNAHCAETTMELTVPKEVQVTTLLVFSDQIPNKLGPSVAFDVDPDGLPVIADGHFLKVLSSSNELQIQGVSTIDDFAWMRGGAILFLTQNHLASLAPTGGILSFALPGPGMRIRPAGENTAYIFGGTTEPANHSVYLFARDEAVTTLVTMPVPVTAVAGDGWTTYIATGRTLMRLAFGEPLGALMEAREPITSLEIAPGKGLFYSTASSVGYVMSDGSAYEFLRGQGGLLRLRGSTLFLLIPDEPNLVRFTFIEGFENVLPKAPVAKTSRSYDEYVQELEEMKRTSEILSRTDLDTCSEFWVERNAIFKTRGYCFKTSGAINYFGNDGCTYRDPNAAPLTREDHARVAEIIAQERPLGCTAQPTAAPQGDAAQATCAQLWVERNSIFKAKGYCFSTARAIKHFGNDGCTYRDPSAVPLTRDDRVRVQNIQAQERSLGCN